MAGQCRVGNLLIVSPSDRYEIRAYRSDGSLARIVRREHEHRSPARADLDRHVAQLRRDLAQHEDRERWIAIAEEMPLTDGLPAFSAIRVDRLGNLWVEEFMLPEDDAEYSLWTVYDPDGDVLGLVEMPGELDEIFEIGADYVLGKTTDDLDVEHVQLWSLSRPG